MALIGYYMEDISEKVRKFLEGHNPMERVVCIECGYDDDRASIIYNREDGEKRVRRIDFYPFVWAKESACVKMFGGDRRCKSLVLLLRNWIATQIKRKLMKGWKTVTDLCFIQEKECLGHDSKHSSVWLKHQFIQGKIQKQRMKRNSWQFLPLNNL